MDAESLDLHSVQWWSADLHWPTMGVRFTFRWPQSNATQANELDRLTEMGYTLVRLFQRFSRIERYYTDDELITKTEIVMQPGNGVNVGLWETGEGGKI